MVVEMLNVKKVFAFSVSVACYQAFVSGLTFSIEINNLGEDKTLKCDHMATYWKRGCVDIFDGNEIKKAYNKTFEIDNTTSNNDLRINRITFQDAGQYLCLSEDLGETSLFNVIVIDKNISCNLSSSSSHFPSPLQTKEILTINCTVTLNASNMCKVKPLWTEKISNNNLTTEISYGYNNGYMWLITNGDNDFKGGNKFWLRIVFTCNLSATTVKEWKVIESVYDTNYISPEIMFPYSTPWLSDGNWIMVAISAVLLLLSVFLIIFIIHQKYRKSRKEISVIRNRPLPSVPEFRRYIRNSIARNPFLNHQKIEESQVTTSRTSLKFAMARFSSISGSKSRSNATIKPNESDISEYNMEISCADVFESMYNKVNCSN